MIRRNCVSNGFQVVTQSLTFAVCRVQSISMVDRFFICLFLVAMFFGVGCDTAQQNQTDDFSDIQGLKLADLQAEESEKTESLLSFSVLSYVLDANSLDTMESVIDILSDRDVRYDNAEAFGANGFVARKGEHRQGAQFAQKLRSIGAVRLSQSNLSIPSGVDESFYGVDITESMSIIYSTSQTGLGGTTLQRGKLGWILSAQADPLVRGLVHLTLGPAFWEKGIRDLRILEGKDPYQYRTFDVGRVHIQLEAGQFLLLGSDRSAGGQDTLNSLLFELPEQNKVRFFVIIFGGQRSG